MTVMVPKIARYWGPVICERQRGRTHIFSSFLEKKIVLLIVVTSAVVVSKVKCELWVVKNPRHTIGMSPCCHWTIVIRDSHDKRRWRCDICLKRWLHVFLMKQLRETCSILLRPKLYQILRWLLLRFSRNYDWTRTDTNELYIDKW